MNDREYRLRQLREELSGLPPIHGFPTSITKGFRLDQLERDVAWLRDRVAALSQLAMLLINDEITEGARSGS